MPCPRRLILAAFYLALPLGPASARAPSRPVEIKDVRVGFPAGKERRCRVGTWSPVAVDLSAAEDVKAGDFELVVETTDSDDVQNQYAVDVPPLTRDRPSTVLTSFKPGNRTARLTVSVRHKGGATVHSLMKTPDPRDLLGPDEVLYLTVGMPVPGLGRALLPQQQGDQADDRDEERAARLTAHVEDPNELPLRWYGFAGADVVVLATGGEDFVERLLRLPQSAEALGEWVRRGGRLVVGVGRNSQAVAQLLERMGVSAFAVGKAEPGKYLPEVEQWANYVRSPLGSLTVARVRLRQGAVALARERQGDKAWPVVALAGCGRGRVLLVAFDLDATAFTGWKGHDLFWKRVHEELGPRPLTRGKEQDTQGGDKPDELGSALQRGLESFEAVPAVSFGWVAFFILLYILIVGPLDYFFLKKVVKRLELTWVSFPVVAVLVGVAAYCTAHTFKGNELRINKIDVVDVDLRSGAVHGTTWFALFSPKLEGYTIGLEPAPGWGHAQDGGEMLTTLSPPDGSAGGVDREGSRQMFRRPYVYAAGAAGLKGVPVPVWASRSFTANWRTRFAPGELVAAEGFGLSRDGRRLTGRLHNLLPLELKDVSLFYNGTQHALENLPPGGYYRVDASDIPRASNSNVNQWMEKPFGRPDDPPAERGTRAAAVPSPAAIVKAVLFHSLEGGPLSHLNNSGLRPLDQGWRLRGLKAVNLTAEKQYLDEVIVLGRAVLPPAAAEEVSRDGASPTRLWLGSLPGSGTRPPLTGTLRQETYVRIYIPVPSVVRGP